MLEIPSQKETKWFQQRLLKWGKSNFFDFPWRSCESPIHQIIVEILLQRTKAEQVVPIYEMILGDYPTIDDLSKLSEYQLRKIIHPLGLHWRASYIKKLIWILKHDLKGRIPDTREELLELPGIGSYVASAYLSFYGGKRSPIIDTNVVRVYARFFGFNYDTETRRKKWVLDLANHLTPKRKYRDYSYALLDFARSVCKSKPLCFDCYLKIKCMYFKNQ